MFVPLPYFRRSCFVNFSTHRFKSLHAYDHLPFAGKNGPLYCRLFSSNSLSVCLSAYRLNVVDVLARSSISVLIVVAFRHLATKSLFYFACCHRYCFHGLGCRAVLRFFPLFLILAAIFIAVPFSLLLSILSLFSQTAIIAAFHSRLDLSFVGLPFLLWSCRHIHFAAKDAFVATTSRRPVFFLVLILLVIFTPSFSRRYSYCHCPTHGNSHTVVLSKPASYSPALFSIPVKRREHAYQSFIIGYGMEKVWWLCG